LEPAPTPEQLQRGNRAVSEFIEYLGGLVAARRRSPGDPDADVLTRLILGESDGQRLTETELLQNCIFILNAGHETTTNLIGNGLFALLEWPEQRERLTRDPSLIKTAIEEFLRFESSNQLGNRITTRATEIGGVALPPQTSITLCIGAANRDPERFVHPDRLDIGRQPNRHLAFASGPHQCVGMNVARLEGRIAISRFLARFPNYRGRGKPARGGRVRFRGFLSIPVSLH
jgi:cytochrome P450